MSEEKKKAKVEEEIKEEPKEAQTEVETKEEEVKEDPNDKFIRLMADYQNLKRRAEQEKKDIYAYANEKIVKDMLNVIDNFERALSTECADQKFKDGMELILKQLLDVLEKAGVSEIEALGKEFDPNFHNAVMMEETEEYESGKVSFVMQKGYILNSRVVRPSMVKVSK